MPSILIIAGPNGAGKTTFANRLFEERGFYLPYLNADEIGRDEFPGLSGSQRDLAAGRALLQRLDDMVSARKDFAVETTLSSLMYAKRAVEWRHLGYEVMLTYIRLPSAEASIARVAKRVSQGGHGVPAADLRRRYGRSLANLEICKGAVDYWEVWESGPEGSILIERSSG